MNAKRLSVIVGRELNISGDIAELIIIKILNKIIEALQNDHQVRLWSFGLFKTVYMTRKNRIWDKIIVFKPQKSCLQKINSESKRKKEEICDYVI